MSVRSLPEILSALLFTVLFTIIPIQPGRASERPRVQLAQGVLEGSSADGVRRFAAIPYAAPPIDDRRWAPPLAPSAWQGTRSARAFGPSCMQPLVPPISIYADDPAAMSEDCLTLNVWAEASASDAPVIVWIHGGSLRIGSSSQSMYDGTAWARQGVVFVSINYRLGVFGWLAHPALSAESPHHASGNYGLLDQIQALRWVRENIAAFGGNPDNVTVMGESAGALSVTYLLTSPLSKGLFAKAIAQSANIRAVPERKRSVYGLPAAEDIGRNMADVAGADDLDDLRTMDAGRLMRVARAAGVPAQGTIDGWALREQVVEAFDAGRQAQVPLLAGFNSGEVRSQRALVPATPANAATYEAMIKDRYVDLAPEFLRLYPSSAIEDSMLATVRDAVYGWATERMIRQQSAAGLPAYLYIFNHCYAAARARDLCAFHASEVPFLFGQVGKTAALTETWPRPTDPGADALSSAMRTYWVNFAKTGRPNGPALPAWSEYGAAEEYMRFDDTPVPDRDPVSGMFELQEETVSRRRSSGQQWFLEMGVAAPIEAQQHHPAPLIQNPIN